MRPYAYEPLRGKAAALVLAQFLTGGMLAWGLGYWWLGQSVPAVIAVASTFVLYIVCWRIKRVRGAWVTALAFFATLSKLDPALAASSMGDLRVPLVVGGSLLSLGYGVLVEERERFAAILSLKRRATRP